MVFPQIPAFAGAPGVIRLVGHRGARGVLPENTLEGFEFALKTGVDLLELDVTATRDGVVVITHNHHLTRSMVRDANGNWLQGAEPKVSALSYAELLRYDVGGLDGASAYGRRFPDQAFLTGLRIPRLADLLALLQQPQHRGVHLLLEIKSDPDLLADTAARQALVEAVVSDVRAARMQPRTVLHSFDWDLLADCQRIAPEMPASYLTQLPENTDDAGEDSSKAVNPVAGCTVLDLPDRVAAARGRFWCPYYLDITPQSLARARELGLVTIVWTVNAPEDIERMIDLGVDAICSDYPGRVQRLLLTRGLHWRSD
ncbi:glycerophosphodiester phosphodiesterase family protein [Leisingera methylohalidivorans]|uniref:Glycerophosphoryl diester phosphodiesterase n=1 Tax=Leisingera methylohalidivorans DSM 14336 TaxID=999552 RepID=V9W2P1_9RHOB|nr:glycerophosphodiester phosphodiesterase family protein [Leisingera methylohalidivorans]AHD03447.1 glycerophosphoryl diester phosphodiesterase [Leisingera methylohalidivorans DSM 14336]